MIYPEIKGFMGRTSKMQQVKCRGGKVLAVHEHQARLRAAKLMERTESNKPRQAPEGSSCPDQTEERTGANR